MAGKITFIMGRLSAKSVGAGLLEHLDALAAKLHERAPAALEVFDPDDVHAARVATRRLSAALDLTSPVVGKRHRKPLAAGLKKLRRRLGPLRDADVMVALLDALAKDARHAAAAGWLRDRVAANRESRQAKARNKSAAGALRSVDAWSAVRDEVAQAHDAVDCLLAESLHRQVDAFAERADRLAAGVRGADGGGASMAGGAVLGVAVGRQDPHALRVAGKALRYTLEMAAAAGRSPGAGLLRRFKRMQDLLGDWHDLVVLADRALREVVAAELTLHDAAGSERVLELARVVVRRSARELEAFAKLWTRAGDATTATLRSAFPLTRDVSDVAVEEVERAAEPDGPEADPEQ
ncbi:MAG: domain containing protein [Phycisphaerales bacterium]|nr:domain containing protein [Phycisphaerales bacterium]